MKKQTILKTTTTIILCGMIVLSPVLISGCGAEKQAYLGTELTEDLPESAEAVQDFTEVISDTEEWFSDAEEETPVSIDYIDDAQIAVTDFGVRLMQKSVSGDSNTLISPISVLYALAMTANGANGETLTQFEQTFRISMPKLNEYLYAYAESLPNGEKYKLSIANSIWFRGDDSFTVNQEFLQTNQEYYNADLYQVPFDNNTLKDINQWVNENTDEMIPRVLDRISEEAMMYLINAVAFDAEWQHIYDEYDVRDGIFTKEDGTIREVELMYSSEDKYLEHDYATGFMKYYKDRNVPERADLTGIGFSDDFGNLYISRVLHKTFIAVDEKGTKAGAVTAVAVDCTSAMIPQEYKTVYLDRPFVYLLIDCENNLPIFIGTVTDME